MLIKCGLLQETMAGPSEAARDSERWIEVGRRDAEVGRKMTWRVTHGAHQYTNIWIV